MEWMMLEAEQGCVWVSGGLKENSASGTSDPCSCATRVAQRDPAIQELKPKPWHPARPSLRWSGTAQAENCRWTRDHLGRTLAPPNWQTNRAYRAAAESGSLFRDDADDLRVRVRSWIASVRNTTDPTSSRLRDPSNSLWATSRSGFVECGVIRSSKLTGVKFTVVRPSPNIGVHWTQTTPCTYYRAESSTQ